MQDLKGRTAVVTGAASGIGLGLAQRFAAEGMQLVLCDVNAEELATAAKELEAGGAEVLATPVDVTDPDALDALADAAYERFGAVDVLCPNAGIIGPMAGAAWEIGAHDWQRVFGVNVFAVASTLRSFMPRMLEADREGAVLFTASVRGFMVGTGAPTYQGSKHAVVSLAEVLRKQLADRDSKIAVSAILAGPVLTKMAANEIAFAKRMGREVVLPDRAKAAAEAPMAPMQPAEIAEIAVEAIKQKQFYVFTHENSRAGVMSWLDGVIAALDK